MHSSMKFLATIKSDGSLDFNGAYNDARWRRFCKMNPEKTVRLELAFNKRSLPQNALYWMWLDIIAGETGNAVDDVHRYMKGTYGKRKTIRMGDKVVMMPESTTEYTVGDFVELLMHVEAEAAQLGITLPQPEQDLPK